MFQAPPCDAQTGVNPPMQSQGMQSTQGMQPQMQGVGGGEQVCFYITVLDPDQP